MSTVQEKIELMLEKKEHLMQGGGAKAIEKQHGKGHGVWHRHGF